MKKIFKININVFMTRLMAVFLLSSVMIFSCGFSVLKPQKYTFINVGNLKSNSISRQEIVLNDGKVLFLKFADRSEIYDPKTKKCRFIKNDFVLSHLYRAILLEDGNVLITAGISNQNSIIFNTQKESFTYIDRFNNKRIDYSLILLKNGDILVTGGISSDENSYKTAKSAEIYNPQTEQFTLIGNMNIARKNHKMILLNDGRVLILGGGYELSGKNSDWKRVYNAEIYNPVTNKFTLIDEIKMQNAKISKNGGAARRDVNVAELQLEPEYASLLKNGKVIIIERKSYYDFSRLYIVEFDPNTNKFKNVNQIQIPKNDYGIGFFDDGRILTVGGHNHFSLGEKIYKSAELINLYTGEIKKLPNIGEPMLYTKVIRLKNGNFLIVKYDRGKKPMYEFITY